LNLNFARGLSGQTGLISLYVYKKIGRGLPCRFPQKKGEKWTFS